MDTACTRCDKMERALRRAAGIIGSSCAMGEGEAIRAIVIAESLRVAVLQQAADAIGHKERSLAIRKT